MVNVSETFDPLLKRPFGIFKSEPPFIWLYFEVVGKGTKLLSNFKKNDKISILGPLGNSLPEFKNKKILMIAGGRGFVPIFHSIHTYSLHNDIFLVYGAKSEKDLNLYEEIKSKKLKKLFLYTDNGSVGKKGLVTSDVKNIINNNKVDITISCGPEPMFKTLVKKIEHIGTENYISMEAIMGCGFGICHSCAKKTKNDNYKQVCTDGPIFKMEDIKW
jgi:dihydroorotate dehydrogenase electron transfer subunit